MRRTAPTFRNVIALVAMLVLLAQTFTTAWAAGASPYGSQVDAFGNPLCVTGSVSDAGAPADDQPHLPSCCTLGCGAMATALPAPGDDQVVLARPAAQTPIPFAARTGFAPERAAYDPGNPRAPPPAV
jgi:hypothetical protein